MQNEPLTKHEHAHVVAPEDVRRQLMLGFKHCEVGGGAYEVQAWKQVPTLSP
jgi:hypothetical protein